MATVTPPSLTIGPGQVSLQEVPWELYCQLRDQPANHSIRMTYLDGELVLMSPEMRHDHPVELLNLLIRAVALVLQLEIKGIRTTTLRRAVDPEQTRGAGKESDAAYYIGANEGRMRRRDSLDLSIDPPPDLAIEVENSSEITATNLSVYARLRVPEIWRFRVVDQILIMYWLDANTSVYAAISESRVLPGLTPDQVHAALARYGLGDMGEIAWSEWLKGWARGLAEPEAGAG